MLPSTFMALSSIAESFGVGFLLSIDSNKDGRTRINVETIIVGAPGDNSPIPRNVEGAVRAFPSVYACLIFYNIHAFV